MAEGKLTHQTRVDEDPTGNGNYSWTCSCGAGSEEGMVIPTRDAANEEAERHLQESDSEAAEAP
jgi:hypothetical protein